MFSKLTFIQNLNSPVHPSWDEFVNNMFDELANIEKDLDVNGNYTPKKNKILHFLTLDLTKCKIIILGQDPYPQKGIATGRAFEVGNLKSWHEKFSNISLKNIIRAIYYAYYNKYLKYSEIVTMIHDSPQLFNENEFAILPPNKLFKNWEQQGVLLLNTSFTCEIGIPGSHGFIWKNFTLKLLEYIAEINKNLIWFLWGNHAIEITSGIKIKNKYESMHPMMCYEGKDRNNDFLFGKINHFFETKDIINWVGKQ
ncbi:uracil-DNA glycosylase [Bacteroidota bacterium]